MVAAISAIAVLGLFMWLFAGIPGSRSLAVADLLEPRPPINPTEATAELYPDDLGCIEGWRTDVGDYVRFASTGQAEHWAIVLGDDGRIYDDIVLDFRAAEPDFEGRRLAIDVLYSTHSW